MNTDTNPNARRAERVRAYLQVYADEQHVDLETALADSLANLMHFARANGYDFSLALARAEQHVEDEVDGDE